MSEQWVVYLANISDKPASILVNVALAADAPFIANPMLLTVHVKFSEPDDDGLTPKSEAERISHDEWEDKLTEKLCTQFAAIDVGRLTMQGWRDVFYYVPDEGKLIKYVEEFLSQHAAAFETKVRMQADAEWEHYFDVLYPTAEDFQRIGNREVIQVLEAAGDDHTKPRLINHAIHFSSAENREAFLKEVLQKGYQLGERTQSDNLDDEFPFSLSIERVETVDINSINRAVLELFALANQMSADYDGWETSVEK